jgi:hypothetical protein
MHYDLLADALVVMHPWQVFHLLCCWVYPRQRCLEWETAVSMSLFLALLMTLLRHPLD